MKIIVIGAGAMGSIYGGHLSLCNDVTLVDTNAALVEKINHDGLVLEENGVSNVYKPKAQIKADSSDKADLIILFTKSLYSKSALDGVRPAIGPDTYLMTLQNGAGHERLLSQYVDREHIIIGTTEDNGAVLSLACVHHGGRGVTNIGLLSGEDGKILHDIKECFDESGFDVKIHSNIQRLIWDKLMTNASLSVLTAILQCDMSYIAANENARGLCLKLIDETVSVANAMNLGFDVDEVIKKVLSTSESNKGGYTSIMMDIKNSRRTEVDTISGAVVAKAHELGISVPCMEMAVELVHALEGR